MLATMYTGNGLVGSLELIRCNIEVGSFRHANSLWHAQEKHGVIRIPECVSDKNVRDAVLVGFHGNNELVTYDQSTNV